MAAVAAMASRRSRLSLGHQRAGDDGVQRPAFGGVGDAVGQGEKGGRVGGFGIVHLGLGKGDVQAGGVGLAEQGPGAVQGGFSGNGFGQGALRCCGW